MATGNSARRVITPKGTYIQRCKRYGVGKEIGTRLYLHRNYARCVLPEKEYFKICRIADITFNCMMIWFHDSGMNVRGVRLDKAPNFDTEREPSPVLSQDIEYSKVTLMLHRKGRPKKNPMIWHHKWLWVMDDYEGFDIEESWRWSNIWTKRIRGTAKGSAKTWKEQLEEVGLT